MNNARSRAYDAVPETCSKVNGALDRAFQEIKETVTEPFRDALIETYEEIARLESALEDMKKSRDEWQERAKEAEAKIDAAQ